MTAPHSPEYYERRQRRLYLRWERASALAGQLTRGEWDEGALTQLANHYFEGHRTKPDRDLDVAATIEWGNWAAEQARTAIDLLRLERERPHVVQLRKLWADDMTPSTYLELQPDAEHIAFLHEQVVDTLDTLQQSGFDRQDLRVELQSALTDDPLAPYRAINTMEDCTRMLARYTERQLEALQWTAEAFLSMNESEMSAAILRHKRLSRRYGDDRKALVELKKTLKNQGRDAAGDLEVCRGFLDQTAQMVGPYAMVATQAAGLRLKI